MSVDSSRRGVHKGAQTVSPQPIVDKSIIDSVAGIINDIVPQAYAGTPNSDNKESITWARFEYADVNDPALYPDYNEGSCTPPLLLVLGYTTGVQVWLISATGEATEVLSWRQGVVRTLRILPNPKTDDEHIDLFEAKRPMVAICDSAGPGPQFCNISFISLKTGEQAKNIKFKNPVCDILANRRSIVVAFLEKIAVFDARTLEDILTVTTCYASPGPNPNPVALGTRWLAYSEKKLLPARRSSGGCEGEGVQSYTATVLYAAKSLGKGLRGLGETVASSLTGNSVSPLAVNNMGGDVTQPGVVTILDLQAAKEEKEFDDENVETITAHFTAHTDAIVAMTFDLTGALLMTADKRGHDFHVFRIQPHPGGPTLAAVHHLYILHRGDTTAKVQDMTFSSDTRWAAVSTVRGTTHVFPVAPYGGPVGVRTHSTPHVVNRLSRFHRSAGLTDDGARSHSPVSHAELPLSMYPYSNPRLPPYPHPTILHPLAQIRQPSSLSHVNSQSQMRPQQRQRLHSDDSGGLPLKICACFAPPRAWIYAQRESSSKIVKRAIDSLFIMACHGNMIQYDLEPKPAAGVPKEKVCDDTMIELEVEAKGQWPLLRSPSSLEIVPPLQSSNYLLAISTEPKSVEQLDLTEDRWLSQVEIVTHAGPHRRLWMGPQFIFKTYSAPGGVPVNLVEAEAVEVGVSSGSRPARSNPVNMPHASSRPLVPVVIDGSGSSYEQSPRFMEAYGDPLDGENMRVGSGENQLREDLAEAMLETSIAPNRVPGRRSVFERVGQPVAKVVNPLGTVITVSADEDDVSSSQEFDFAEEGLVPDPPRSVCAEEGPASLGDLEPESQTLRDLTEICAEMRSASEPAIDSVADENMREVRERKELCVEMMAATAPRSKVIDFEREESFRDVPTSLSLCAEQGEIPSSPMTQAKETAWCKRAGKRDDVEARERNVAKAKYVVNYDEDCVVLMENRSTGDKKTQSAKEERPVASKKESAKQTSARRGSDGEKAGRKSGKGGAGEAGLKRVAEPKTREKYIVKEQDDSIVIEDTRCKEQKSSGAKRKGAEKVEEASRAESGKKESKESKGSKESKESKGTKERKEVVDSKDAKESKENVEPKAATESEDVEKPDIKPDESFVELEKFQEPPDIPPVITTTSKEDCKEEMESVTAVSEAEAKDNLLTPLEPPSLDDLNSMEYHMVEANTCKDATSSNQSDEDIEHIQNSELNQMPEQEYEQKFKDATSCSESSPVAQRKSSKSTISDDDLEYIHSAEIIESLDHPQPSLKSPNPEKIEDSCRMVRRHSKHTLSSDDDLEHVQHSDICELESASTKIEEKPAKKTIEVPEQASKSKSSKKRKEIVVIESDTCESAEVTVIVNPLEGWGTTKTPDKDLIEEIDKCIDSKEKCSQETSLSPVRKVKSRTLKTPTGIAKRPQAGAIEIIDIDALQKAEMESAVDVASSPECKILSPRHEAPTTRSKKSRRNKKSHLETGQDNPSSEVIQSSKVKMAELQEAAEELLVDSKWQEAKSSPVEVSWSSIVKKKNAPSDLEPRKESDLEPLIEVEEKSDYDEGKKSEALLDETQNSCLPLEESKPQEVQKAASRKNSRIMAPIEENMEISVLDPPTSAETADAGSNDLEKNAKVEDNRKRGRESSSKSTLKQEEAEAGTGSIRPECSSKENSPEPEKRSDSEQEVVPEHSSSSDEQNANATPMDTEEDYPPRDVVERNVVNGSNSSIYASKKGNRSKKKKRR